MSAAPNIVYVLADDLGYGDLSCLNPQSKIKTPHMDRLAAQGRIFTDAHANSAVCTPTRYGVLTGRYCWRGKLKSGVLGGYAPLLIEEGRLTVPALLHGHGYLTGCVGKWHLGLGFVGAEEQAARLTAKFTELPVDFTKPLTAGPHTVGFDYSYIIPSSLDIPPYCYIENGHVTDLPLRRVDGSPRPAFWRAGWAGKTFRHETCLQHLTAKAVDFIATATQPFFLHFTPPSPHTPHCPRPEFRGQSQAGPYGDLVVETDWSIGQLLAALEKRGLADNTLFIVTSDNGAHIRGDGFDFEREYGHRSNYVYRGQKSDAWDGGHRVPFLARWPKQIPAGSKHDGLVCLTDLLATCAALLEARLPDDAAEDSVSMLPALTGDKPVRETLISHSIRGEFAIRQGPWKLVDCAGSGGWSSGGDTGPQLYHLGDDPAEQRNRLADHPEIARVLKALLEQQKAAGRTR